jgi:NhaA family Na+:H+ antiporter
MLVAAVVAIAWANSPWSDSYFDLWATPLRLELGTALSLDHLSLQAWVNDALMTVFFLSRWRPTSPFAVGVVTLLGSLVPLAARVFLLTLAIADGIGAIVVIAVFYTGEASVGWLGVATTTTGSFTAPGLADAAKVGILAGSLVAGVAGFVILRITAQRQAA